MGTSCSRAGTAGTRDDERPDGQAYVDAYKAGIIDRALFVKGMNMEIKTPWLCAQCSRPVQTYFCDDMKLPCAYCDGRTRCTVAVPRNVGGEDFRSGTGAFLSVVFTRAQSFGTAGFKYHWSPEPCIDGTCNSDLTAALVAAGLGGCLVPKIAVEKQVQPGRYAVTLPVPADRVAVMPYFGMQPEFFGVQRPGLTSGVALEAMVAQQDADAARDTARAQAAANALYPAVAEVAADAIKQKRSAECVSDDANGRLVTHREITRGDAAGVLARADADISGCRLGCRCGAHGPARPAPWVPSVDDFDLLPDAP